MKNVGSDSGRAREGSKPRAQAGERRSSSRGAVYAPSTRRQWAPGRTSSARRGACSCVPPRASGRTPPGHPRPSRRRCPLRAKVSIDFFVGGPEEGESEAGEGRRQGVLRGGRGRNRGRGGARGATWRLTVGGFGEVRRRQAEQQRGGRHRRRAARGGERKPRHALFFFLCWRLALSPPRSSTTARARGSLAGFAGGGRVDTTDTRPDAGRVCAPPSRVSSVTRRARHPCAVPE